MLLQRLQPPLRAAITSITRCTPHTKNSPKCLNEAFAQLTISPSPAQIFVRYAHHASQGAVNKAKDGPGKRLGAKKSGEQYVIPGNIIFRQRGTLWFPGENCAMGRDHTIYATECGYVKYYKDPERHPKRQYIGVVFERDMILPLPRNAMRRRRLGMLPQKRADMSASREEDSALPRPPPSADELIKPGVEGSKAASAAENPIKSGIQVTLKLRKGEDEPRVLSLRPNGYMFRESNWEIGRAAERAKVKVKMFKPRDRWVAWRKASVRKAKNAEKRGLGRITRKKK